MYATRSDFHVSHEKQGWSDICSPVEQFQRECVELKILRQIGNEFKTKTF